MSKGMSKAEKAELIGDYLKENHTTEVDAINAEDLFIIFHIYKQDLRRIINLLRSKGVPICSSNNGYWYSEDINDIDRTIIALFSRIDGINRAIHGLIECRDVLKSRGE